MQRLLHAGITCHMHADRQVMAKTHAGSATREMHDSSLSSSAFLCSRIRACCRIWASRCLRSASLRPSSGVPYPFSRPDEDSRRPIWGV